MSIDVEMKEPLVTCWTEYIFFNCLLCEGLKFVDNNKCYKYGHVGWKLTRIYFYFMLATRKAFIKAFMNKLSWLEIGNDIYHQWSHFWSGYSIRSGLGGEFSQFKPYTTLLLFSNPVPHGDV